MNMMNDKSKKQKNSINTRHILFIVSGAFSKLAERIQRRLTGPQIGFMADHQESDDINSYLSKVETSDLVEYGFEPEFVGRLPVRVACEALNENDLEELFCYRMFSHAAFNQGGCLHLQSPYLNLGRTPTVS